MKPFDIRQRILLAALIPALLVASLLSTQFVLALQKQAHESQHRRLAAIAKQIATLAEYDLFVGYQEGLGKLVQAARQDPDIVAAVILDAKGHVLASTLPAAQLPDSEGAFSNFSPDVATEETEHWHVVAIEGRRHIGEDLFLVPAPDTPVMGRLLLKVSNAALHDEARALALQSAALTLLILLFGLLLAWALSRRLVRMLMRISHVVDQTGHGIGGIRIRETGADELGRLAAGIDRMIGRVEISQAELVARVMEATTELRQEKEAAEAASLARSRFFAAASHDLRQPVQALGLFAARLKQDVGNSRLRSPIHKLGQSVRSLQQLIDTLLDYSRLDGQVFRIELQAINARQMLGQLIDDFAIPATEKGIALRLRVIDGWLMTDAALLRRLLLNLLSNAVRHTCQGGVLVACRPQDGFMRIEVWDTGPGIPAEYHEAIFEELFQLDNPERDTGKGLGLGLAIVRRIADLLCHPIRLCSRIGHGSRFSVLVPLGPPPVLAGTIEAASGESNAPIVVIGPVDACSDIIELLERWRFDVYPVAEIGSVQAGRRQHAPPQCLVVVCNGGHREVAQAVMALDRLEAETGHCWPTLLIGNAPLPDTALGASAATRLLLSRPFLPARLRALLTHLLDRTAAEN